jgi:SAM-dependent methyltransferase
MAQSDGPPRPDLPFPGGGPPGVEGFDAVYEAGTPPPWDIGRPQPALAALGGQFSGRFLDVGCGTGEHALLAAELGLEAVGVDASSAAIARAEHKAHERGLDARFVVGNAFDLAALGAEFDTVVDCGLYHLFDDDDRVRYVASLAEVVRPGGRCYVLCFSDRQPGDWGPRRVSEAELRTSFADGWRVDAIEPAELTVTFTPEGVLAWLTTVTRLLAP